MALHLSKRRQNDVGLQRVGRSYKFVIREMHTRSLRRSAAAVAMMIGTLALSAQLGRVDIGAGRRLYLECRGSGSPAVILEAGLRGRADVWSRKEFVPPNAIPVMKGVARFTRVCEYDRPGTVIGAEAKDYSRSDPQPMPRTALSAVRDLHRLLRASGVRRPYVLVGHSFGGLIARLYAATYPHDVVGMVLVDALPEQLRSHMTAAQWKTYTSLTTKPPPELKAYKALEVMDFDASMAQLRHATKVLPPKAMPVVVLSKGRPFELGSKSVSLTFATTLNRGWSKAQSELAAALPRARHVVVADSAHNIQVERPDLVVLSIRQVIDAFRAGRDTVDT